MWCVHVLFHTGGGTSCLSENQATAIAEAAALVAKKKGCWVWASPPYAVQLSEKYSEGGKYPVYNTTMPPDVQAVTDAFMASMKKSWHKSKTEEKDFGDM